MFDTVEMRWFFTELPLELERHFDRQTELQQRTDWYSMPCSPVCGIKVREGRLEAKLRTASLGVRQMTPLVGVLEGWRKWSLEFADDEHPTDDELRHVDWLPVAKRRNLSRFEVRNGEVMRVHARPSNGCEFESTELVVDGRTYWTVGFEAVGLPEQMFDNLRAVAARIAELGGLLQPFAETNSFGYAKWLSRWNP